MTYTSSREIGRTIDFVPVGASLRNRFSLSDDDVEQLARHAVAIENHYGRPMETERSGRHRRLPHLLGHRGA